VSELAKGFITTQPVAFMSDSRLMKAIIGVASFLIKSPIKSFSLQDELGCFDYLQIPQTQRQAVRDCLAEMANELT
jgi:hypothetical protein